MDIQGNHPLVVAVVLTWNDTKLTSKCLASVFASDYPNTKVVLVDNGSEPPCGPSLKQIYPEIDLIQVETNKGFSGGANKGLERGLELGGDYICLIGNDSTLAKNAISRMVETGEEQQDIGAVGPILLDPGQPEIVQFYQSTLDRTLIRHDHLRVGETYVKEDFPTTESEFIPAVALLFRGVALREVGLLDESFGTCWEDFDMCIRLQDAGWRYVIAGGATAVHLGSHTTGKVSPYITYYTVRNRLLCIDRYAPKDVWRKHGYRLLRSFFWQVRRYGFLNFACHAAFVRGIRDYLKRTDGEDIVLAKSHQPGGA